MSSSAPHAPHDVSDVTRAWHERADELAAWADRLLVNRRDVWGGYYQKNGTTYQTTRHASDLIGRKQKPRGELSREVLVAHFQTVLTDGVCGLHTTYRDTNGQCWSRFLVLDIDAHDDTDDSEANWRYACSIFGELRSLGFWPLLLDSNGKGGYHIWVIFDAPQPTPLVFALGRWLIRRWEAFGLAKECECFPKQPEIRQGGCGNWVRIAGHHHTRVHYTRVWDGSQWLDANEAIDAILRTEGASADLIPAEARVLPKPGVVTGETVELKGGAGRNGTGNGVKPGADFATRTPWADILCPAGWIQDHADSEGIGYWRRPGKTAGYSATTNHNGNDTFYVFTDGSTFKQGESYSKFGAWTVLNHQGDFTAATKALAEMGYGSRPETIAIAFAKALGQDNVNSLADLVSNVNARATGFTDFEALLRAKEFHQSLAVIAHADASEAEAITERLRGIKNFRERAFQAVVKQAKKAVEDRYVKRAQDSVQEEYDFTDSGNARRLVKLYRDRIRYCKPFKEWLIYDGKRWKRDDTLELQKLAKTIPPHILAEMPPTRDEETIKAFVQWSLRSQSRTSIDDMINLGRSDVPVVPSELDADPWLFNCANGTVDLRTGQLRPHNAGDLITKLSPVNYNADAEAGRWEQFEKEIFQGDPEVISYMRRAVGYALSGDNKVQELNILHGEGSNGKNVYMDTVRSILGDYACQAVSDLLLADRSDEHPTGLADLEGKRFVVASETDAGRELAEALVKGLTGDDVIKARGMNENYREIKRTWKLFLSTNHMPNIKGTDHGIWRRIRLVPFSVTFVQEDAEVARPLKLKEDAGLREALATEYEGILKLFVDACIQQQEMGMAPPDAVKAATQEYQRQQDVVQDFILACCLTTDDSSVRVQASKLYAAYKQHCDDSGINKSAILNIRDFNTEMTKRGYPVRHEKTGNWRFKIGLRAVVAESSSKASAAAERRLPLATVG
jgi:P4 family phage/plasmid primase-like protien